jgi:ribonuclease HI
MSWKPVNPNCWIEPTGNLKATFDAIPGVTHHHVLDVIEQSLTQQLWLNASQAYCGDGMELGTPHFGPAALAHRDLLKESRMEEAAALDCIIANKSWTGERLSNEIRDVTDAGLCLRCGGELETPAHRYYTCPKNKSILHKDVQNTMDLVGQACSERQNACKWFRGIMPGSSIGNPVGWMDETLCKTVEVGEFTKILNETGAAAGDGGGGKDKEPRTRIAGTGIAAYNPATGEFALLFSRVPGRQTVPRAELWALFKLLERMSHGVSYRVYIDAQYVLNGLANRGKHYSEGSNGDIWTRIYDILSERMSDDIEFIKIKSHLDTPSKYVLHQPSVEGHILNELADAAATAATKHFGRADMSIVKDQAQFKETYLVAKRIATIEAEIWRSVPNRPTAPSDRKVLIASRTAAVKRKLDGAIANTDGDEGHRTYQHGNWTRCYDCPARSRSDGQDQLRYWIVTPCMKRYKRNKPTFLEEQSRNFQEYLLPHPVEHFQLGSDSDHEQPQTSKAEAAIPPRSLQT